MTEAEILKHPYRYSLHMTPRLEEKVSTAMKAAAIRAGHSPQQFYSRKRKLAVTPILATVLDAMPGTVEEIAERLGADYENTRGNVSRLMSAGLVSVVKGGARNIYSRAEKAAD